MEDSLKTGLLKWSKDFVSAAMSYEDAVKLYIKLKLWEPAMGVYKKLVEVNKSMHDNW
jgi:hypothetical protein